MSVVRPEYVTKYGYSWWDAVRAEFWWRIEHAPLRYEGQIFAPLARLGYRRRKTAERRGAREHG